MKKHYQQPTVDVVEIHAANIISTSITNVSGGGTSYGGGSSGPARTRRYDGLDGDGWDE